MEVGHLAPIDQVECRELMRQAVVGRLAWIDGGRVQILPLTCSSDGHLIRFRTSPHSPLATVAGEVVFEIDDLDPDTRTGWSVVARGIMADSPRSVLESPAPWAPGERELERAIRITDLSGRSVAAGTQGDIDVYA